MSAQAMMTATVHVAIWAPAMEELLAGECSFCGVLIRCQLCMLLALNNAAMFFVFTLCSSMAKLNSFKCNGRKVVYVYTVFCTCCKFFVQYCSSLQHIPLDN